MSSIWKFEETVYQTRALLEVMQDGLCNGVVGINQDFYATTIRTACNLLEGMQQTIEEDSKQRREERQNEMANQNEEHEDDGGFFAGEPLFGDGTTATSGSCDSYERSEGCEDSGDRGTAQADRFVAGSLGVTLVEEHEDGSATFEVNGSKEQMGRLFSAFFTEAITKGIDSTEQQTGRWITERRLINKAIELEKSLKTWESVEEFDYDPEVRRIRTELTDLIIKYGAVR